MSAALSLRSFMSFSLGFSILFALPLAPAGTGSTANVWRSHSHSYANAASNNPVASSEWRKRLSSLNIRDVFVGVGEDAEETLTLDLMQWLAEVVDD